MSRAGEIGMAWRIEGEKVVIECVTPSETELVLPDGTVERLVPGRYRFEVKERED